MNPSPSEIVVDREDLAAAIEQIQRGLDVLRQLLDSDYEPLT